MFKKEKEAKSKKVNLKEKAKNSHRLSFKEKIKGIKSGQSASGHVPLRLNILFLIIFGLFVALIVQLAYLQIANEDIFQARIDMSEKKNLASNTPRGEIYDSKGQPLVVNQAEPGIIYTKSGTIPTKDQRKVAEHLSQLITIEETDKLTERDKKDFWLADEANFKKARKRVPEKETLDKNGEYIGESAVYPKIVKKVKDSEIQFDAQTMEAATIFKQMNSAYALTSVYIKSKGVTKEEVAAVGENIKDLPGISVGTDWNRTYPQGDLLSSVLGTVSTEKTGLPAEELDSYLAKGYSRNDRVGISYLEKEYESVLKGTKSQSEILLNNNNEIEKQTNLYAGEKGKNLQLTIDTEFQKKVDDILQRYYSGMVSSGNARFSNGAYVVVSDPKTGAVKAMSGYSHEPLTGTIEEDVLGTFNKAFKPGSVVKGATISAGYEQNVISGNQVLIDEPVQIAQSALKSSYFNRSVGTQIPLTATEALRKSSNAYMMKIVFLLLDTPYTYGMSMPVNTSVFETLRHTYSSYGLGTSTGLDLPGETEGIINDVYTDNQGNILDGIMGNLLDLSYGNYDTYTAMQLAQYVATVANNGKRMAMHVVNGIYGNNQKGGLGDLEQITQPKLMNEVNITQEEMQIIQEGFYQVVNNGGTGQAVSGAKYKVSGKTGTAEDLASDGKTYLDNSTFIGYAPSDNPKVAVSVVLPGLMKEQGENTAIAKEVFDAYYDMYEGK